MEHLGIAQISNRQLAFSLHMVPKADSTWLPCGAFHLPNNIIGHDCYPIPHVQYLSVRLAGTTIFSKVDLHGYHQVLVRAFRVF